MFTDGGGYFTEGRSNLRKGGDIRAHRELQKLNTQLAEQKKITEDYRGQLLAMESEMSALKDLASANKEVLKTRTKSMVDQVDLLKERYESLEKRRKQEGEGYQNDIHLLKQKLKHVEQQLIRAAVNRTKGNFLTGHCSKSSFFVQKFNFDFPKKLSISWGEKLVKMLWFWTF